MNERDWLAERFEENRPRVRAVAYRMLGSMTEAEDAVQETWIRLNRSESRTDVAGTLGPFDARITYGLAPVGSGTRLTNRVDLDPRLAVGFVGDVVGGRIRAAVAENLGVLKTLLEGGAD